MKVIKLTFKESGKEVFVKSYTSIYKFYLKEDIGVGIGHVWNVASKNNGRFENSKVIIERIDVN